MLLKSILLIFVLFCNHFEAYKIVPMPLRRTHAVSPERTVSGLRLQSSIHGSRSLSMSEDLSSKVSFRAIKRLVSPAVVGSVVLLSSLLPVSAKTGKLVAGKESPTVRGKVVKGYQNSPVTSKSSNKVAKVTLQVANGESDDQQKRKQQLTRIGLTMIGLSVLYGLMSSAKPTAPPVDDDGMEDLPLLAPKHITRREDREDFVPARAPRRSPAALQPERDLTELDPVDDIFSDEVSPSRLVGKPAARMGDGSADETVHRLPLTGEAEATAAPGRKDSGGRKNKSAELVEDAPPLAAIIPAPADSRLGSPLMGEVELIDKDEDIPTESATGRGEESSNKSPMGFLSKFFQKPGGGRPADIAAALQPKQASADADKEERFRVLTAQMLLDSMPSGTFPNGVVEKVMRAFGDADLRGTGISAGGGGVASVAHLQEAMHLAGLSLNQAAEAYADVANALLVSIVDTAVDAVDHRDDAAALASLENAVKFIAESGGVYNAVTPGASIAPIQYNGKARGGKLEDLYYRYAKAGADMGSLLSGFLGGQEGAGAGASRAATAASAEERGEQLASLQFYFNVKEKRRDGIEQRIMRESIMDMAKSVGKLQSGGEGGAGGGEEGMDSLAQLLDGMLGKGGHAGQVPGFPSPDMLQGYSAEAAKMGLPDFSKLSPEEAAALSKDALGEVKEALAEGRMTRQDVQDFERTMGVKVADLLRMVDQGQMSRAQLQQMGPDFAEMVDVFRQLVKIK